MTDGSRAGDRPWLGPFAGPVTEEIVAAWRKEASHVAARVAAAADDARSADWTSLRPGITVVILSRPGEDPRRVLEAVRGQTLGADAREIILVGRDLRLSGWEDRQDEDVRILEPAGAEEGLALRAAARAARMSYVTFTGGSDTFSPGYLAAMLASASPRSVLLPSAPQSARADVIDLTRFPRGALLPTTCVQITRCDAPDADQSVLFWASALVEHALTVRRLPDSSGAAYTPAMPADDGLPARPTVTQALATISALESLVRDYAVAGNASVTATVDTLTDEIAAALTAEPQRRHEVTELLDRAHVFHLPYERLNRAHATGLAIAYAFTPYVDTSALVTAKRLRERGEIADVVYNAMDSIREIDVTSMRIAGPFVGRLAAVHTPSYFASWGAMASFVREGRRVVDAWVEESGPYRWVYSRAHFAASHFLAAAHKLEHPGTEWVAEFSDPISRDIAGGERGKPIENDAIRAELVAGVEALGLRPPSSGNAFVWCEELTYALADKLVFTNENQLDYMLSYCSDPVLVAMARAKAMVQPQPVLPEPFYRMAPDAYDIDTSYINLAYFGNFYASRGPEDVLAGMARLQPQERARLRLHFFTSKPTDVEERAVAFGVREIVRAHPYLPYLGFLRLTRRFDCLIVNDADTAVTHGVNPFLPSKYADYRGSGTPIWGLVEAGSPLSGEPLAHTSAIGDVAGAAGVLRRIAGSSSGATAVRRHESIS